MDFDWLGASHNKISPLSLAWSQPHKISPLSDPRSALPGSRATGRLCGGALDDGLEGPRGAAARPVRMPRAEMKEAGGLERPKSEVLIALAFAVSGLIGQSEPAAAVDGVQTFERQGRS
jgi:hypothetical protein